MSADPVLVYCLAERAFLERYSEVIKPAQTFAECEARIARDPELPKLNRDAAEAWQHLPPSLKAVILDPARALGFRL